MKDIGHCIHRLLFKNYTQYAIYHHKYTFGLHVKIRYPCEILMKLKVSRHIFEKYTDIKFNQTPSTGSRVGPCLRTDGRTDRHDEANNRFSKFWECA